MKCVFRSVKTSNDLSLPSRERGLKYAYNVKNTAQATSLPSRERGLKYYNCRYKQRNLYISRRGSVDWNKRIPYVLGRVVSPSRERGIEISILSKGILLVTSLPSRERGLKYVLNILRCTVNWVALLAGAWIEILYVCNVTYHNLVAPLAGAWIEMLYPVGCDNSYAVALAGAWIEIIPGPIWQIFSSLVARMRERGLKF